jgi:signal transduction histidine kinase
MYIDLFNKGTAGPVNDKQKEYLKVMREGSTRLSKFIDDLLDIAKIERGKLEVKAESIELEPIVKETVQLYQPQADNKKIKLGVNIETGLPKASADPERTRQVLNNLLSNAIKFTPENGSITVEASYNRKDNTIEVAVQDTGIGIPEDKLESVFNKFEQVKDARQQVTTAKGTGLGLAIIRGILEQQGGKIWVTSNLNQGSRFIFSLKVV